MHNRTFCLCDNDVIKWNSNGKMYCLHIQSDADPENPRENEEPVDIMACWHTSYALGDHLADETPERFWQRLVRENVPNRDILTAAESGKLSWIRIVNNRGQYDIYETYTCGSEREECLEYEHVPAYAVASYLLDDLTIEDCMTLMAPYAEWLPLWLYDHS